MKLILEESDYPHIDELVGWDLRIRAFPNRPAFGILSDYRRGIGHTITPKHIEIVFPGDKDEPKTVEHKKRRPLKAAA